LRWKIRQTEATAIPFAAAAVLHIALNGIGTRQETLAAIVIAVPMVSIGNVTAMKPSLCLGHFRKRNRRYQGKCG
jgi:hypothetical protein